MKDELSLGVMKNFRDFAGKEENYDICRSDDVSMDHELANCDKQGLHNSVCLFFVFATVFGIWVAFFTTATLVRRRLIAEFNRWSDLLACC